MISNETLTQIQRKLDEFLGRGQLTVLRHGCGRGVMLRERSYAGQAAETILTEAQAERLAESLSTLSSPILPGVVWSTIYNARAGR